MDLVNYTKRKFGAELILMLESEFDIKKISKWANSAYYKHMGNIDDDLKDIVQTVVAMDCGPEFELTKDQLLNLATECVSPLKDLKSLAQNTLDRKIDVIEGIWELSNLIQARKNYELASMIKLITSETDEIILKHNQGLYSKEFLETQEKWKTNYVKNAWPSITKICETILALPEISL